MSYPNIGKEEAEGRSSTPNERGEGYPSPRDAVAENPFDALADHAEDEYRAGRTRSLRGFAVDEGIVLRGHNE